MGFNFFKKEETTGYIVEVWDAPAGDAALSRDSAEQVKATITAEQQNPEVIKIRVIDDKGTDVTSQFQA